MIGRRLPIERGQDPTTVLERSGDYCGPVEGWTSPGVPAVFFIPPNAAPDRSSPYDAMHHITTPPHTFRECDDGSLEVRASILCHPRDGFEGWHGYLDEGNEWRA